MAEFKVGDKVTARPRNVCTSRDKSPCYTRAMEFGGIAEVIRVGKYIRLEGITFSYRPEWLELVEDEVPALVELKGWLEQCIKDGRGVTYTTHLGILDKIADLEKSRAIVDWSKVAKGTVVAVSDTEGWEDVSIELKYLGTFHNYIMVESGWGKIPVAYKFGRLI